MAVRIKSKWHDTNRNEATAKGLEDHAGALAFIMWRVALDKAITLHGEDYIYTTDGQRIAVICEYLAFAIQVADRLAHRKQLSGEDRHGFITTLAHRVADHVEDNAIDLFGPGDYRSGFIETLNDRSKDYAEFAFTKAGPSYSFTRYLGHRVQGIMGKGQVNRWVIDQVMEVDGPEVVEKLEKAMHDLFGEE